MVAVRVTITRWVYDDYPGFVEAQLVDAHGRAWSFIDKEPIVNADCLDATSPCRSGWLGVVKLGMTQV